jgi:alcohol dehydrogenase class IV
MQVDFATASRIVFGAGKFKELPQIASGMGQRAFITRSKSQTAAINLIRMLESEGISAVDYIVSGEPDVFRIQSAVELARSEKCDFVIGLGGGSVIDTGKAVSALLSNTDNLMDYLEVVGLGKKLVLPSRPYIAIPSTAGTGSEVTRNSVIAVPDKRVKVSMRSPFMLPDVALVDPELSYSMPPALTASTGMDAFIQVIEPYVSNSANSMVDMFCRDAIPRAAKYLLSAYQDGGNVEARDNMAWVSLMGGLSLANAKLGAAHGFAGPIGGMFQAPHGAICASVITGVVQVNISALKQRAPESDALKRYEEIVRWITGNPKASLDDGIEWQRNLCAQLQIPRLSDLGINKTDFEIIVEKSENSSSMKGNPVKLTRDELTQILEISF